jgi:hypothetical protein
LEPELPPAPEPTLWSRIKPLFDGLGGEPTAILCGASAFLIVSHYQGSAGFFRTLFGNITEGMALGVSSNGSLQIQTARASPSTW